jgi:DNA mismatch repair protein MutL
MTMRVQRLDPVTASRIAAGEVIERPASVVKELIDNALDAGSTRLDIDLHNGGRRLIQVTDNGSGMSPEDAVLALQRFTTSKIRRLEDLSTLTTLGFRGEALPSMVAVAEVEIYTRLAGQPEGVLVRSREGEGPALQPVGCPVGTRVGVRRLFAHVPVRLRALKSVSREVQQIQDLVAHYALAHPHITFHLRHDGRRLLFAPACADLVQRLPLVLGRELAAQLLPVHWQSVDMRIYGAVSTPAVSRATRQRQYFWVNGRPVHSGLLSAAVARAYGALLPPGRHPLVALGVTLPPDGLDINVHPRKSEMKFLHERAVFAGVQEAVERVLQRLPADAPAWQGEAEVGEWSDFSPALPRVSEGRVVYAVQSPSASAPLFQPLGQIGNTFVVANGPQGLLLLDQHAAHERLIYDRLLAADEASVELAEAFLLPLTPPQLQWVMALQPALTALRFQLEPFGKDTVIVRAVPAVLSPILRPGAFLEALHEARQRLAPQASPEEVHEQLCAALACRTALRAGDCLDVAQMAMLVEAVAQRRLGYTCPHGRPTHLTLSLAELERRFLRFFPLDTSAGGC